MPWSKDYEDFQRERGREEGPSEEDHYDFEDLDFSDLDTRMEDDHWHRSFVATGSINIDSDWF